MPTTWNDVVAAVKAKMPEGTSLKDVLKAASPEWKRIKSGKHPTKGMASLTMPGKEDFTTKKSSKVFHRKGHYETESAEGETRRPYHGKRKSRKQRKSSRSSSSVSKLPMSESVLVVEESPMAGGQAANQAMEPDQDASPPPAESGDQAAEITPKMEERLERAEETTGTGDVHSESNLIGAPGMPTAEAASQQEGGRRRRGRGRKTSARRHHQTAKKRSVRRHRKTAKRHGGKRRH